jgi:hypothetical protein
VVRWEPSGTPGGAFSLNRGVTEVLTGGVTIGLNDQVATIPMGWPSTPVKK